MRGQFITLEGSEGAGKSTNVNSVCTTLDSAGIDYLCTREPGGTPMAEALRESMLYKWEEQVDPLAELLLLFAARAQHEVERDIVRCWPWRQVIHYQER